MWNASGRISKALDMSGMAWPACRDTTPRICFETPCSCNIDASGVCRPYALLMLGTAPVSAGAVGAVRRRAAHA